MSYQLRNAAKDKLAAGEPVLCFSIRQLRTVDSAMIAQACGFDVVIVDREHAPISTELTSAICVAALGLGLTPLVRVAALTAHDIGLALDGGALGVIVPQVNNRADAESAVRLSKYPPLGQRSVAALGPAMRYQPPPLTESIEQQNAATLVCVLLETGQAIVKVREIASVPGVDVVMIGSVDLSTELGRPGHFTDPAMQQAYASVAAACHDAGKQFAVAGGSIDQQRVFVTLGARLLMGGIDVNYLIKAASQDAAALRALL